MPERKGYNTKAKEFVTGILKRNKERTLSAAEIYSFAKRSDAGICESTVYRMLSRM